MRLTLVDIFSSFSGRNDERLVVESSAAKPNGIGHLDNQLPPKTKTSRPLELVNLQSSDVSKCTLRVTGMTCGSCVGKIERHLNKQDGENDELFM